MNKEVDNLKLMTGALHSSLVSALECCETLMQVLGEHPEIYDQRVDTVSQKIENIRGLTKLGKRN